MTLILAAPERIETERLVLRKPRPEDAEKIFRRYASDPEVARYMGFTLHESLEATKGFLERNGGEWARTGAGAYVIEHRTEGAFLGGTGLHVETAHRAATGYVLARDAWGHGYATEALTALTSLVPALGIVRLYAYTHTENRPSWRVLEKCGFEREGILRKHFVFPNLGPDPRDVFLYARIFAP
ncbi:MAG TPA: GNAT family N-acetyltransferase, partial [Candidatus Eisenbacteria bacterium]|nr:GNAT family N-acetyltransferase [Candidatus Eisenbacteria bacterium]